MVSIVPNTFLLDLVNNVNGGGNGVADAGGGRNFKFPAFIRAMTSLNKTRGL